MDFFPNMSRVCNFPGGFFKPGIPEKPGIFFLQNLFAENCFQGHNSSRNKIKKFSFWPEKAEFFRIPGFEKKIFPEKFKVFSRSN